MIPKAARAPIIQYLILARVQEPRPVDVQSLYQAVADDTAAIAWLDQRFVERVLPAGWRELENDIEELAYEAASAGLRLERISADLLETDNPLGRLRCLIHLGHRRERTSTKPVAAGRELHLDDLIETSRRRIELFAIEEGFYFGLPPIETVQLYQDVEADPRAVQYLDRRFTEGVEPSEWADLRERARTLAEGYERLGYLASVVLGEQQPRTSDRSAADILAALTEQLQSFGGAVAR